VKKNLTHISIEGLAKPIPQIKKVKIRLFFVGKLVHSPTIDLFSRLNQSNFTSFFFTHQVLQSPPIINTCYPNLQQASFSSSRLIRINVRSSKCGDKSSKFAANEIL
jgi:hypothetical protein